MVNLYVVNSSSHYHGPTQQTRDADPMADQCRASVVVIMTSRFNAGPSSTTMDQYRTSTVYRGLTFAGFG